MQTQTNKQTNKQHCEDMNSQIHAWDFTCPPFNISSLVLTNSAAFVSPSAFEPWSLVLLGGPLPSRHHCFHLVHRAWAQCEVGAAIVGYQHIVLQSHTTEPTELRKARPVSQIVCGHNVQVVVMNSMIRAMIFVNANTIINLRVDELCHVRVSKGGIQHCVHKVDSRLNCNFITKKKIAL
jgi:hypothetical protein